MGQQKDEKMNSTNTTPDAPIDIDVQRARLAKAKDELREIENAVARGELVPRQKLQQAVASGIERVSAKMLEQCEEIAPLVVAAKTVAEVEAIIEGAAVKALEEFFDPAEVAFPANDPGDPGAA